MKVLVTGGAGYIGSTPFLNSSMQDEVVVMDNLSNSSKLPCSVLPSSPVGHPSSIRVDLLILRV